MPLWFILGKEETFQLLEHCLLLCDCVKTATDAVQSDSATLSTLDQVLDAIENKWTLLLSSDYQLLRESAKLSLEVELILTSKCFCFRIVKNFNTPSNTLQRILTPGRNAIDEVTEESQAFLRQFGYQILSQLN